MRPATRPAPSPHRPATGSASDRGRRRHAADAVAVKAGPDGLGVAVADGVGDSAAAAVAARAAADAAAELAAHDGAVAALLAAGEAVRRAQDEDASRPRPGILHRDAPGDAVMVVAAVRPGHCEIAWVGDCRAYLWDDAVLRLLTKDQTAAQAVRDGGGTPPRNWENVVMETVAGATVETLGHREVPPAVGRLALLSGGVHHELSEHEIAAFLERSPDCAAAARGLTDMALLGGAGDNAGATVIDMPILPRAAYPIGSTNPRMPAVPAEPERQAAETA
ncbi:MAG: family protein phosphatase [Pseudonocardiales bacterium]|nr:family protein phosphatase [Pseudonocardiales bacterium]